MLDFRRQNRNNEREREIMAEIGDGAPKGIAETNGSPQPRVSLLKQMESPANSSVNPSVKPAHVVPTFEPAIAPIVTPPEAAEKGKPLIISGLSEPLTAAPPSADGGSRATREESEAVKRQLQIEDLFQNDKRLIAHALIYSFLDISSPASKQALRNKATEDYINAIMKEERNLTSISPLEAITAYQAIKSAEQALQKLVDDAKTEGKPIPEGIVLKDGKVEMSPEDDLRIVITSIKEPRIAKRLVQLTRTGTDMEDRIKNGDSPSEESRVSFESYLKVKEDKELIMRLLNDNPDITLEAIDKEVSKRRNAENMKKINAALDVDGFQVGTTPNEREKLMDIVNAYRDDNKLDDEHLESLNAEIKYRAVANAVDAYIAGKYNNPAKYPWQFNLTEIIKDVLAGNTVETAVERHKTGENPTLGSTLSEMRDAILGEIGKIVQS